MQSQKTALTIQQARAISWLNLYRAAGGGWEPNMPVNTAEQINSNALGPNIHAVPGDAATKNPQE
jgi:hypothetical protein